MKHVKLKFLIFNILILIFQINAKSQNLSEKDFRSPVGFPISLSGNFGELRNNHFHSGIDIRTFGIGKNIYSAGDGYISRIKISPRGYGRAIYINHPNGYTTVYAHLHKFNKTIETFIKNKQYKNKKFAIDINLKKGVLDVKKSQIIAISGNSGSSGGPHLHFEIRETLSEHPINPLLSGIFVKDNISPRIHKIYIYPLSKSSSINGESKVKSFQVIRGKSAYFLKGNPKITVNGDIGFAISTNDYMNNTNFKFGVYNIKTIADDSLLSEIEFNSFSFANTRYVNSHMDYSISKQTHKRIHKTFVDANNKLKIYKNIKNKGIISIKDNKIHRLKFICTDKKGNKSDINIKLYGQEKSLEYTDDNCTQYMPYDKPNTFSAEGIEIKIVENSLYNNLCFNYSSQASSKYQSDIHNISSWLIPLQNYYSLKIKYKGKINKDMSKVDVYKLKNNRLYYKGGLYISPYIMTKTNEFGSYVIATDSIAPTIKPYKNYTKQNLRNTKRISFKIRDNMSGIRSYNAFIDNKWVLLEYDLKKQHVYYYFDSNRIIPNKNHKFKIEVTDRAGNVSKLEFDFYW